MNTSSPNRIPNVLGSLAYLEDLSLHDQGLFLLSRLATFFPRGKTFWKIDVFRREGSIPPPNWLAPGIPKYEIRMTIHHLSFYAWNEILHNGWVAEAPPVSGWYEITDKGWEVVESNTCPCEGDGLPF